MANINISIDTQSKTLVASVDGNPVSLASLFVDDFKFEDFEGKERRIFAVEMVEKPKSSDGVETQTRHSFRFDSADGSVKDQKIDSKAAGRLVSYWQTNAEKLDDDQKALEELISKTLGIL